MNNRVVYLYALLARDFMDFIEECGDSDKETLDLLYKVLTLENKEHTKDTKELNDLGARLVKDMI